MKTLFTTILVSWAVLSSVVAQTPSSEAAYQQAMGQALQQWQQKTPESTHAALNSFDRIAAAKPDAWLPAYYAAFIRLQQAIELPAGPEQDKLMETILQQVDNQLAQHPNHSELLALKGYHHMMYVAANPMSRGPQYSGRTLAVLQQAIAADSTNPRAYLLLGQMKLGMARFMNSPTDEACSLLAKAADLYAQAASNQPGLEPSWGSRMAIEASASCGTSN
jgi:hypothetical protein